MTETLEKLLIAGSGGLTVFVAGKLFDWVKYVRTSPKLAIDFQNDARGYRVYTKTRVGHDALSVSISVTNERRQTAKNCRGFLVGIEALENGKLVPTDYCDSVPLAWAYRSDDDAKKGIDIPKGVVQFLNVFLCGELAHGSGFVPSTVPTTLRTKALQRFAGPGEFRFKIQVSADNVETQLFGLRVSWAGDWSALWNGGCELLSIAIDNTVLD